MWTNTFGAQANVIDYPNGSNSNNAITLIDNNTQLQVLTGFAVQTGVISEAGGAYSLEKVGAGTLVLSGFNTYSGGTIISAGTLNVVNDAALGSPNGTVTFNGGALGLTNVPLNSPASRSYYVGLANGTIILGGFGTIAGAITGPGHMSYLGFGGLTLTGNSTYLGGTTIDNGALVIGDGGTAGSIVGNVVVGVTNSNTSVEFNRSDNVIFSGDISGIGRVFQFGSGNLVLTGNNSQAATTVAYGTLTMGSSGALGTGALALLGGSTLSFSDHANYTVANSVVLWGNARLTPPASTTQTISGAISDGGSPGAIEMQGAGTLVISGLNTYTGGTTVSAGLINFRTLSNFGAGNIMLDGGGLRWASGNTVDVSARLAALGAGGGTVDVGGNDVNFASTLSGVGGLTKAGVGTLYFSDPNNYSGGTTILAGRLQLNNGSSLGTGAVNLAGGSLVLADPNSISATNTTNFNGGTIRAAGSGVFSADLNIGAGASGTVVAADGMTLTLNGALITGDNAQLTLGAPTDRGNLNFNLSHVTSGYQGSVEIAAGAVQDINGHLSDLLGSRQTTTEVDANATFTIPAGLYGIANLQGAGQVTTVGDTTLTVGGANFSGQIGGPIHLLISTGNDGIAILSGVNTYSGGTIISDGKVQIGNINALGAGIVSFSNGTLISTISGTLANDFDFESSTCCFSGSAPPSLAHVEVSPGQSLVLAGSSIHISGSGMIFGSASNSGTIIFSPTHATIDQFSRIEVAGGTLRSGNGQLSVVTSTTNTNTTVDSGAILDLNGFATTVVGLFGDGLVRIGGTKLSLDYGYFSGTIDGAGVLEQLGASDRPTVLIGANTHSGGTIIDSGGILQLGDGGTTGSISGNIANSGSLIFNRSDFVTFAGAISGGGAVSQVGTGMLIFSGANTYVGATTVNAGTLNVTGSIAKSSVVVGTGGTLTGTGKTGSVNVASDGSLNPGTASGTGALTVEGNLTLAPGATTSTYITPTTSGVAAATGTASIDGTLIANAAPGTYAAGQRYTLVSAAGGLNGTYSSFNTPGLPAYVKGRLGYDANDAYLYLDVGALSPLLPPGTPTDVKTAAAGIDAPLQAGAALNNGIKILATLSGRAFTAAMDQVSGQVANGGAVSANQTFTPFLAMLTQAGGSGPAANFGPQASYDAPDAPHPAKLGRALRVWSSAFGGRSAISGDAASGAHGVASGIAGLDGGIETALNDDLLVGASLAGAHASFSTGDGHGGSDDVMLALYGRRAIGHGYLAGALGYGWHDIDTRRAMTVSGTDVLTAEYQAHDFGGRLEGGYYFSLGDGSTLTPFAAFAAQSFRAPAYGETAASGSSDFALAYAANSGDVSHSELGAHYGRGVALQDDRLALDATLAWEHELGDNPLVQATFQSLPGSQFILQGATPAIDTVLLGLGAHMERDGELSFGFHGDARVGDGTTILTGTADLSLRW